MRSEFLIGALGSQGIHELGQADPPVQLVSVEASQETLQFYLAGLLITGGLLAQLCRLIEVALKVAPELARREEATLEPVKLIEDGPQGHWHTLLHLLSHAFNHAFGIDRLSQKHLEQVLCLSG